MFSKPKFPRICRPYLLILSSAVLLTACGGAENKDTANTEKTLAQQMSEKLDAGEYDVDYTVSSDEDNTKIRCHMYGSGGDGCVTMDKDGVYTEFYTVDDKTYMLVPEVECYELIDESGGFGNAFIKLGKGDILTDSETNGSEITETYSDENGGKYIFVFDKDTQMLKSFTSADGEKTTFTEVENMSWEHEKITLPDISDWKDVGENAMVDEVTQLKFSLYISGGVTESDVNAAGYSYEEICGMDIEQRKEVTEKLLNK